MKYHQQMMNVLHSQSGNDTYKQGHKDARHQCAEIALEADARIATETKRAEAAEAQRDKLAELLRKALPVLRLLAGSERSWLDNGDYCGAPDYTLADSGDEHATRIDAALAEMERNK